MGDAKLIPQIAHDAVARQRRPDAGGSPEHGLAIRLSPADGRGGGGDNGSRSEDGRGSGRREDDELGAEVGIRGERGLVLRLPRFRGLARWRRVGVNVHDTVQGGDVILARCFQEGLGRADNRLFARARYHVEEDVLVVEE